MNLPLIVIVTDYVSMLAVTSNTAIPLLSWKHLWASRHYSKEYLYFQTSSHLKWVKVITEMKRVDILYFFLVNLNKLATLLQLLYVYL